MNVAATPSLRLAQSRERLRRALNGSLPAPEDDDFDEADGSGSGAAATDSLDGSHKQEARQRAQARARAQGQRAKQPSPPWWKVLAALPGAGIVREAVHQWWMRHPLRVNFMLAITATQGVVQPVAQRHPLALVAGAFVVGAVMMRFRPLRRPIKPALFAGLLPQLLLASMSAKRKTPPTRPVAAQD